MIRVFSITLWELFKTLYTGKVVAKFNDTLFKASEKLSSSYKHIKIRRSVSQMKTLMKSRPGKKKKKKSGIWIGRVNQ